MSYYYSSSLPMQSKNLPLTLINLKNWSVISLNGSDSKLYLQNQLTCNIKLLKKNNFLFSAYCNSSGKVLSTMYVFFYKNNITLIQRSSVCNEQIKEFKKYSIFYKINILLNNNISLIGIAGKSAKKTIYEIFKNSPNKINSVMHHNDNVILYFNSPSPRFLIITNKIKYNSIIKKINNNFQIKDCQQWLSLEIESGHAIIDKINIAKFIPQSLNLHLLNYISFNKGCYLGQEIIAKVKYRNLNKHILCLLKGFSYNSPNVGDNLEVKINNNWIKTGTILTFCCMHDGSIWIQAVINKNLICYNKFRMCINYDKLYINKFSYITYK